jgi:hypothetical protein
VERSGKKANLNVKMQNIFKKKLMQDLFLIPKILSLFVFNMHDIETKL